MCVPEAYEWPEDEILDAPPATQPQAPALVPPPVPGRPLPPAPRPLLPTLTPPPPQFAPPPAPKRPSIMPVVVIGTVAAAAVAVIAVAVVASGEDKPKPPAEIAGTPLASLPPAAQPSGPVTDLALTDNGDSLAVTWTYPSGANGPVIVSAAFAGEPMRAMQSLPAGAQTYTLPVQDKQRDYCVTVTVAYSSEKIVTAPPVCTKRKT